MQYFNHFLYIALNNKHSLSCQFSVWSPAVNTHSSYPSSQPDNTVPSWYRRISLRYHLIGHYLLTVVLILGIIWALVCFFIHDSYLRSGEKRIEALSGTITDMIRQTSNLFLRARLQGLVEINIAALNHLHQEVLQGRLSRDEAQKKARQTLPLLMKYINGQNYTLVLSGSHDDAKDNRLQKNLGPGLHLLKLLYEEGKYQENLREDKPKDTQLQAIFISHFMPWDWTVSLSTYLDSTSLFNKKVSELVSSLYFESIHYICILNTLGEVIYHPWLQGSISQLEDPAMRMAYDQIIDMKTGYLSTAWQEPDENGVEEKNLFFQLIPELDWIVVTTAGKKESFIPELDLGAPVFFATLAVLFFTWLLSSRLANMLTRPLARLAGQMNSFDATGGAANVKADEHALGEIGLLGRHFNSYMEKLHHSNAALNEETKEKKSAKQQLFIYQKAFENAYGGVCITDSQARALAINQTFIEVTGYTEEDVIGQNMNILQSGRHGKELYASMWQSLHNTGRWSGEIWNKRKNGEIYPEILNISAIYDDAGNITHFVGVFHDITEMKYEEERIAHQAYHDPLTGLPNRTLALDRIGVSIAHVKRGGTKLAVLFLDLDNFKHVNDTLGHEAGDQLLMQVANRLKTQVREEDTVARLGGDEFLVLVAAILDEDTVVHIAQRILRAFSNPFFIKGQELFVTVSIGIAFYPQDGDTPSTLIRYADVAMYQAKSRGKNNYHLFTADLGEQLSMLQESENTFRRALVAKEFEVYYQPKFDLLQYRLSGVEALVRWRKPEGRVIGPMEFIPLAEQTGLILPLGEQIFNSTCLFIQQLREKGYQDLIVSVNLSPLQFDNDNLVAGILAVLKRYNIPGSCLELELTESAMLANPEKTAKSLNQLVKAGLNIALDDFGTGYSSLVYLKKLPISTLKIDNSFIRNLPADDDSCQLVKTIIMMARNLDISMIAEGVETQEQVEWLRNNNCEQAQGYYYSKPLSEADFFIYLQDQENIH